MISSLDNSAMKSARITLALLLLVTSGLAGIVSSFFGCHGEDEVVPGAVQLAAQHEPCCHNAPEDLPTAPAIIANAVRDSSPVLKVPILIAFTNVKSLLLSDEQARFGRSRSPDSTATDTPTYLSTCRIRC